MIYLTYIFMFVLWLGTISKHNSFRASLPLAFRIQNGLFSLILVTLGMLSYNTIALIVLHPSCIPVLFYIKVGSISPGVACGVKITMAVVDAFCLSVGFWMIQLKEKGFLEKMSAKILDNLKFVISSVHIRFENNIEGRVFAAGLTLERIECFTTNSE